MFYAFESDPDLCFVDIHEDGDHLYPGTGFADETGTGDATGMKLNIPMRPGANDKDFLKVWPEAETFIRAFKPDFIIFQCGADSIKGDPITDMAFTPKSHAHAASSLCNIADEFSRGRIIALGGGGYNRTNLAAAWNAVLFQLIVT